MKYHIHTVYQVSLPCQTEPRLNAGCLDPLLSPHHPVHHHHLHSMARRHRHPLQHHLEQEQRECLPERLEEKENETRHPMDINKNKIIETISTFLLQDLPLGAGVFAML